MKILKPAAILGATFVGVAGVLALNPSAASVSAQPTATTSGQSAGGSTSGSSGSSSSSGSSGATSGGKTLTGDAVSTPYGDMQVQATVTDGKLTDVTWLQLPSDGHSMRINSYAAPLLVQEALKAQSAQVDGVSGATYTSGAFRQSLQSALSGTGLSA